MSDTYVNKQGKLVVNGRIMPTSTHESRGHSRSEDDYARTLDDQQPDIEPILREIERETIALRYAGKLPPFVERQPIGVIPRRVRVRPPTATQMRKVHNHRMEEQRAEMLSLRRKNDAILEALK